MKLALDQIHGKYEESFQLLFNWAAQIEQSSPGSIVQIEVERVEKKQRFRRIFVALKPCIDGFLEGCRPFIGVDASYLCGKYRGQLASATGTEVSCHGQAPAACVAAATRMSAASGCSGWGAARLKRIARKTNGQA